jgi:hypothetical protein
VPPLVTAIVPDLYQGMVVPYPKGNGRFAVLMIKAVGYLSVGMFCHW